MEKLTSLADRYSRAVEPYIHSVLVDSPSRQWLVHLLRLFPNVMSPGLGFECRLDDHSSHADVSFYLHRGDPLDLLAGVHPMRNLPDCLRENAGWQRLIAFGQQWLEAASSEGGVDSLWLEFDKSSARLEATPPRFFLKIGNDLDSKGSAGDALDSYLPIINTITGMHWEDFVLGDMGEFWEGWPQGARIFQMGGSVEPVKNLLRVCIRDIPLSDASAFLESKGWASTGSNAHLFDDLSGLISRADLSIDLSDDGISRVGVECHTKDGWSDASRWDALLAYLREKGLLLHGKYEALRAFPGYTNDLTEKGAWVSTRVPQFVLLGYQRWLHHVKLSLSPVSVVSAKAYLAANLRGVSKESWVPLLNSQMAARRLELERRGSGV